MADKRVRVAAIDPHTMLLEAVAALICPRDDMTLVATETSGVRGLQAIADGKADVIVIGPPLRDINWLTLAKRIVNEEPTTKVVILSMQVDRAFVQQAFHVGVKAYVSKSSPTERFLEAITAAAQDKMYLDPAVAAKTGGLPHESRLSSEWPGTANWDANLTKRETDTVRLVALGYTGKEIANPIGAFRKGGRGRQRSRLRETGP